MHFKTLYCSHGSVWCNKLQRYYFLVTTVACALSVPYTHAQAATYGTSALCSPKTDHLRFPNPTVCMYEHAPGQAPESQRSPDLVDCSYESLKEKAIWFFDTLERDE